MSLYSQLASQASVRACPQSKRIVVLFLLANCDLLFSVKVQTKYKIHFKQDECSQNDWRYRQNIIDWGRNARNQATCRAFSRATEMIFEHDSLFNCFPLFGLLSSDGNGDKFGKKIDIETCSKIIIHSFYGCLQGKNALTALANSISYLELRKFT